MKTPSPVAPDAGTFRSHEIAFSLVMSVVAVLNRNGPLVRYPDILWSFVALLVFNLACQLFLRRRAGRELPWLSTAANIVLVTWTLSCSGGDQSRFWPMYLLPLFTACLYLERRHVFAALLLETAFLGCFYLEGIWDGRPWEGCEWLIKAGVLALAAGATLPLAQKERAEREALAAERAKMDEYARDCLRGAMPGIAHNLNNPLTVILGSIEILLQETPGESASRQDLLRIQGAALACARLAEDLRAFSGSESDNAARAVLTGVGAYAAGDPV